MRVAALYDIHGNLPALEAVLAEVRQLQVDQIVVGGDVVPGPMPRGALDRLLELNLPVHFIRGNGDREVLAALAGEDLGPLPEPVLATIRWTAQRLEPQHQRTLAGWPPSMQLTIDGLGQVLFCHASPRNDTDVFTRTTSEDRLRPLFDGVGVPLVVCGHTHMQFDRTIGALRLVNAGSVGMPFGVPGAYWLLLGPEPELRHTPYGLAHAAATIRATDYLQAEDFAENNVLNPPTEAEALELFAKAEVS